MCLKQSVDSGQLGEVHAGKPGKSEETARAVDETSRRHGRIAEVLCDGHVEPVQLRQQRVQCSSTAVQGRQHQAAHLSAKGM